MQNRLLLAITSALLAFIPLQLAAWQQRVHYTMEIQMDVAQHSYTGYQRLVYVNNSPDTLREVFYHLFYEAFKPGSMMDRRDRDVGGGGMQLAQLPENQQGSVRVATLTQNGNGLQWTISETILHAVLATPLAPGDSATLEMTWATRIPRLIRRGGWMSREGIEFSMSQWYPKMAEYDRTGWHPDEYVRREFYGVYGTYDVAITIPAAYVLGGTGMVTNPREVGCGYELGAVDTVIQAPAQGGGMKTWRFHADSVHDFAWVADPRYVHRITRWHDVAIHLLATPDYQNVWQYAGTWTRALMEYYSLRFGRYLWPQFTVAMAGDGGMEYPQLIMITGYRTQVSLAGVIAHELGHQWYYGMMGNNETQEAWMDEGFTQYLTDEAARNVLGTQGGPNPYHGLDRMVYPWIQEKWANTERAYELAVAGLDEPLDTYHDRFRDDGNAGLVYSRGESVLRMVQYMLGDSLFDASMRHYYDRWHFHHPDVRDFEHAIEEASGLRLDWFFNEWVGTTKLCDYAIDDLASVQDGGGWRTTLSLSNRAEAIMPLDITMTYDDGTTATANVPVEEWRKPDVEFNLPRWEWVDRSYRTTFATPRRVVRATIDTTDLLFDVDRTNNTVSTGFLANVLPVTDAAFYRRWDFHRPLDRYTVRLRPTLWYSRADGVQPGFLADGGYAFDRYNATLGAYYNIRSHRVDYTVQYGSRLPFLDPFATFDLLATNADGVQRWSAEVGKQIRGLPSPPPIFQRVGLRSEREVLVGGNYPNRVAPWSAGGYNTIGLTYQMRASTPDRRAFVSAQADFDASFASTSEFTQWRISSQSGWRFGNFSLNGDMFIGASVGDPPAQRLFNAAGATSRDMHLNPIQRLAMNAEPAFAARNNLMLPTEGFLASLITLDPSQRTGRNLLNARISFGDLNPFKQIVAVPYLKQIEVRAYAAGGWLIPGKLALDAFPTASWEAGVMASLDIFELGLIPDVVEHALDAPAPIKLSVFIPLQASSPLLHANSTRYRWGIGVSM
ncbi:MAG: M1 family metallopeptidase [Bacteroidetes bacterium]|nr:M1 family metallopeptidase [Bacteroidota bacterium]